MRLAVAAMLFWATGPLAAQEMETFDPNEAFATAPTDTSARTSRPYRVDSATINAEAAAQSAPAPQSEPPIEPQPQPVPEPNGTATDGSGQWVDPASGASVEGEAGIDAETVAASESTYGEDDLIGAAEGVFGKGAEGLAKMIEDLLKKEGQPNGYIVGREAGGAFVVGARYGSGTLHHKVEGDQKVYWTGPSIGFDAGANAANTFVLVYNLYDTEDLFKRFPAGEGQAYLVGGLHASYMRWGDVVLIPIRMGAGVRLGVNAGYMKFSKKQRWLPF
ncbi:MAG: DUF1134 domain-containing protein [Erythrobacter sp.]|uniref:DUF1134 domain-containing protein n=1 Tax=Erythrobacter sp. TaxID=1042 RepID=UPI00261B1334|nr:DUF1134 domain-containing protein [Erythrobacter sp.]MDJ0979001.1 DUF1134 domain-containing protein [Erythrobacter sp.]